MGYERKETLKVGGLFSTKTKYLIIAQTPVGSLDRVRGAFPMTLSPQARCSKNPNPNPNPNLCGEPRW